MTNGDIFKSHMYDEVIRQYDEVAEMINLDPNIKEINKLEDAGVERVVFALPSKKRDIILPILDKLVKS